MTVSQPHQITHARALWPLLPESLGHLDEPGPHGRVGGSIPREGGKRRPEAGDSVRRPYGNPVTPFPVPAPGAEQTARGGVGPACAAQKTQTQLNKRQPEISHISIQSNAQLEMGEKVSFMMATNKIKKE